MGRGPVRRGRPPGSKTQPPGKPCAHCGRASGPRAVYAGVPLCFHDNPYATACLRRVRDGGEQLGALRKVRPLPRGMERLRIPARTP